MASIIFFQLLWSISLHSLAAQCAQTNSPLVIGEGKEWNFLGEQIPDEVDKPHESNNPDKPHDIYIHYYDSPRLVRWTISLRNLSLYMYINAAVSF